MNTTLDHLGFVAGQIEPLRTAFSALGFAPTEPKPLMRRDPDSGALIPLEQFSCHVVLARGYLELSPVETNSASHHLSAYAHADGAAEESALQICAFGTTDLLGTHASCLRAGVQVGAAQWAAREIHYGKRRGEARFHWFMVDPHDAPDGLLCFVEHGTPELVYQPEVQRQPNGAQALTLLGIVLRDAAALQAAANRYGRLLGSPQGSVASGALAFGLGTGQLALYLADVAVLRFGTVVRAAQSAFAVVGIEVADLAATTEYLQARNMSFDTRDGLLIIPPHAAGGAILCLHGPGRVF